MPADGTRLVEDHSLRHVLPPAGSGARSLRRGDGSGAQSLYRGGIGSVQAVYYFSNRRTRPNGGLPTTFSAATTFRRLAGSMVAYLLTPPLTKFDATKSHNKICCNRMILLQQNMFVHFSHFVNKMNKMCCNKIRILRLNKICCSRLTK